MKVETQELLEKVENLIPNFIDIYSTASANGKLWIIS